ncbi:MAG: undecaprenyl-diphosphate phosphatase [Lachnospiraceae bacterium]|nr:undecaprenyl-diphosphate phosphatase [Lachnospiraceae bacterium]
MMLDLIEIIKVIILGIVEGITEWLPISSTGHMLLVDEFIQIKASDSFKEMFFVVIQLGAIMAVVILFWNKMFPFEVSAIKDKNKSFIKKDIFTMWFKVVVACIPGTAVTLLFGDFIDRYLETPVVIASTLILYGVIFIAVENWNKKRTPKIETLNDITYTTALIIGLFQVLSIIPGTSRSGATIIGALIIGVSRVAAAEFTFFLAVPVMFGLSFIKIIKFGLSFNASEIAILTIGVVVAFLVSVMVIKFLMGYIRKHDFKIFGWYRIIIGVILLAYFILIK